LAIVAGQIKPEETIYIDGRALLVEIGRSFGLHAIQHENYEQTKELIEAPL
jgi:hypothetical protein